MKVFFNEGCESLLYWLCPVPHKDNEPVNVPSHASSGDLCVVPLELGVFVFGLRTEVFFCSYMPMQVGIVDEGETFLRCFLNHFRS